jgi:ribose 1,5-bisphosphokinase PhnN
VLVVFYGPSGVGKSCVIRVLVQEYAWRPVRTISTRPGRAREDRLLLSREEFLRRQTAGEIAHVNEFYGDLYGSLGTDFDLAISTGAHTPYGVDMSIRRPLRRERYPHLAFAIVPTDASQLSRQLLGAGRSDRETAALAEYNEYYSSLECIIQRTGSPTLLAVNDSTPDALARKINEAARTSPEMGIND